MSLLYSTMRSMTVLALMTMTSGLLIVPSPLIVELEMLWLSSLSSRHAIATSAVAARLMSSMPMSFTMFVMLPFALTSVRSVKLVL